jgi:hypothetical protein
VGWWLVEGGAFLALSPRLPIVVGVNSDDFRRSVLPRSSPIGVKEPIMDARQVSFLDCAPAECVETHKRT